MPVVAPQGATTGLQAASGCRDHAGLSTEEPDLNTKNSTTDARLSAVAQAVGHLHDDPAQARLSVLAQAVDCIAEPDFCFLADITPGTAENWRKRGKGPAYVLIGNRYLYPRQAVVEFVASHLRERRPPAAKSVL